MENFRFRALEIISNRKIKSVDTGNQKISEYFGVNTFNMANMRENLSQEAYKTVVNAIKSGDRIERKIADQVASSIKSRGLLIIRTGFIL